MNTANKVGIAGLILLVVSAVIELTGSIAHQPLGIIDVLFELSGTLLLVYAGIKGSRWWLAIPSSLILIWLWVITRGH